MEEWTEHLVVEDNDAALVCEGDQALEDGLGDSCASKVVWIAIMKRASCRVTREHSKHLMIIIFFSFLTSEESSSRSGIHPFSAFVRNSYASDTCTARDLVELLIRRVLTDDMISQTWQSIKSYEVCCNSSPCDGQ